MFAVRYNDGIGHFIFQAYSTGGIFRLGNGNRRLRRYPHTDDGVTHRLQVDALMGGDGTEAGAAACVGRVALLTLVFWSWCLAGVALDAFSGYFGYQVVPLAALRPCHGS